MKTKKKTCLVEHVRHATRVLKRRTFLFVSGKSRASVTRDQVAGPLCASSIHFVQSAQVRISACACQPYSWDLPSCTLPEVPSHLDFALSHCQKSLYSQISCLQRTNTGHTARHFGMACMPQVRARSVPKWVPERAPTARPQCVSPLLARIQVSVLVQVSYHVQFTTTPACQELARPSEAFHLPRLSKAFHSLLQPSTDSLPHCLPCTFHTAFHRLPQPFTGCHSLRDSFTRPSKVFQRLPRPSKAFLRPSQAFKSFPGLLKALTRPLPSQGLQTLRRPSQDLHKAFTRNSQGLPKPSEAFEAFHGLPMTSWRFQGLHKASRRHSQGLHKALTRPALGLHSAFTRPARGLHEASTRPSALLSAFAKPSQGLRTALSKTSQDLPTP